MQNASNQARTAPGKESVITKAVLRAADRLGLPSRVMANILGVSEATLSRMKTGHYLLQPGQKPYELGVLFVRLYRALDTVTGGDNNTASLWLKNHNKTLNNEPVNLIQTITGLTDVINYLDARRALV